MAQGQTAYMELHQLRYFTKVAETLNFSEAAKALAVTQSTLSQQIKQLEGELGVTLLERDSHHVELTDVGEAFLPQAHRTLNEADGCLDRIRDVQQLNTGVLNIGSTYTFSLLLRETALQFLKDFPGIRLNIYCDSMESLMERLHRQEIDVALSYKPTRGYDDIASYILFDNRLSVVMSTAHPLSQCKSLRLRDLEACHLALPAPGMQARHTFDRLCAHTDCHFSVSLEINEINALLSLVRSSKLVTLLSQATCANYPGVVSIPLQTQGDCAMEGAYSLLKGRYVKRATREFLQLLCQYRTLGLAQLNLW